MSKISFVMPTRNRGERIGASIESILDQSFSDLELVIIDNNSDVDDKTEEVVKNFHDQRIKYYKTNTSGIPEARNFGNMVASSEIIAVADSDDISNKHRARVTIESYLSESWDVFFSNYEIYNEETKLVRPNRSEIGEFNSKMLAEKNYVAHSSSAYTREIAMDFPYNSFFKLAEDYDLFSRLAKEHKKFYYSDQVLLRYIVHTNNISGGRGLPLFDELIKSNRGWINAEKSELVNAVLSTEKYINN